MTYRRVGAKVQVAGFADFHSYSEVVERASLGLGLEPSCNAQLIVSGGLVKNGTLNNGAAWSLGEYIIVRYRVEGHTGFINPTRLL